MEDIRQQKIRWYGGRGAYFKWTDREGPFKEATLNLRTSEGEGTSQGKGLGQREQQERFWYIVGICKACLAEFSE